MFKEFKLNSDGLIPVIAQDYITKDILMQAYMNEEAFNKTFETGKVHYYSRSRQKLWLKGETSGHFQFLKEMKIDCDVDCIVVLVEQIGNACHTGSDTCFYRKIVSEGEKLIMANINSVDNKDILKEVYEIIVDRKNNPKEGSYTNYLFDKGIDKMLKKVGEESAEVIIGAKNEGKDEVVYEISDLIYHLMVLMVEKDVSWEEIYNELAKRK